MTELQELIELTLYKSDIAIAVEPSYVEEFAIKLIAVLKERGFLSEAAR